MQVRFHLSGYSVFGQNDFQLVVEAVRFDDVDGVPDDDGDDEPKLGAAVAGTKFRHDQDFFFRRRPTNYLKKNPLDGFFTKKAMLFNF